jgi:hypothetical protein
MKKDPALLPEIDAKGQLDSIFMAKSFFLVSKIFMTQSHPTEKRRSGDPLGMKMSQQGAE